LGSTHTRVEPERPLLRPDLGLAVVEGGPVRGHAHHGEPARRQPLHPGGEQPPALPVLVRAQLVGPGGRPRHHIRDAEPVREQLALLRRLQQPGREAGQVQDRPEAVAGAGEVVARRGRHEAGVDAAEQHLEAVRDDVRHEPVAGGLQFGLGEPRQRIAPGV
jgi:hypothetical protein